MVQLVDRQAHIAGDMGPLIAVTAVEFGLSGTSGFAVAPPVGDLADQIDNGPMLTKVAILSPQWRAILTQIKEGLVPAKGRNAFETGQLPSRRSNLTVPSSGGAFT